MHENILPAERATKYSRGTYRLEDPSRHISMSAVFSSLGVLRENMSVEILKNDQKRKDVAEAAELEALRGCTSSIHVSCYTLKSKS